MAKKLKWNLILMSLLYLALGIFLLMVPGTALNVVCCALGGVVLACAAVQLVRYFVVERGVFQSQLTLISGLVCLALGAFLIIRSDVVVRVLPIVFGLFVIFDSLGRIQNALELRRCGYPSWKIFLLLAVLSVVLGIVMVVDPFGTMETLVMAIGLILILEAALNLLSALYTMLAVRRFMKLHRDPVDAGGRHWQGPERRRRHRPGHRPRRRGGDRRGVGPCGRERRGGAGGGITSGGLPSVCRWSHPLPCGTQHPQRFARLAGRGPNNDSCFRHWRRSSLLLPKEAESLGSQRLSLWERWLRPAGADGEGKDAERRLTLC
ncbi:MAG: HdeD family acid-resistance protein [Faecalibacterium prausnitzii]